MIQGVPRLGAKYMMKIFSLALIARTIDTYIFVLEIISRKVYITCRIAHASYCCVKHCLLEYIVAVFSCMTAQMLDYCCLADCNHH